MCRLWARGSLRHEPGLRGHQHHGGPQQQDVRAQVEVRGSPPGGFEFVGSSVFFSQEWYKPGPENLVALSLLFYLFLHTVSNFLLWIFLSITPLSPFFFSTITHTTDIHIHTETRWRYGGCAALSTFTRVRCMLRVCSVCMYLVQHTV